MKNSKVTKANSTKQGMNLKKKAILLSMDLQSTPIALKTCSYYQLRDQLEEQSRQALEDPCLKGPNWSIWKELLGSW